MSADTYEDISRHLGHNIEVAVYGEANAAVECVDCSEVLLDRDNEDKSQATYYWSELAELTHETQVEKFGWCSCEDDLAPYADCPTGEEK